MDGLPDGEISAAARPGGDDAGHCPAHLRRDRPHARLHHRTLVIGLVAGFLARAIVPGNDSMSIVATIVLGVVGSFVGGLLVGLLFKGDGSYGPAGWIGSIVGAIIVLLVYNAVTGRKSVTR